MPPASALVNRTCPRCGRTFVDDAMYCPNDGARLARDGSDPSVDPYIGTLISGDIEIKSEAGSGAMGKVYRAHQRSVDRDVAVKVLHREISGSNPLVQRFHREAKIASKLQHPHVVEMYTAGQLPDGALYIVMEYLDGPSLATTVANAGGKLDLPRALSIVLQVCDAVGAGHARGIVHRDLKPENVMLVQRADTADFVKVLDFGIAKVSLGEQSMETAAGLIFGTARYISPEGAQGSTVGPPGDVYSIAVILYRLLTGHTPFDAEQPLGILIKHIHEAPPPLHTWPGAHNVPMPIARVVMDNLAKEPSKRAPSARAFGNALAAAAKEANVVLSDVGVVARMSMLDPSRATASAIDPTLDDIVPPSPGSAPTLQSDPPIVVTPSLLRPPIREEPTGPSSGSTKKRSNVVFVTILAFLLGAAVAALVVQQMHLRKDEEHDAHIARARKALVEGRYTQPPKDNVRDIVEIGLRRWPDDPALVQIKSDTAHELVTRAMVARSAGDLEQSHELAKTALEFDPTDHAASILLSQYAEELGLAEDGGISTRALIEVPVGRARPGVAATLTARIAVRGVAPTNTHEPRFVITGPELPANGMTMPADPSSGGTFTARFIPAREGTYGVVFEANGDGYPFHAERTLDVSQ